MTAVYAAALDLIDRAICELRRLNAEDRAVLQLEIVREDLMERPGESDRPYFKLRGTD